MPWAIAAAGISAAGSVGAGMLQSSAASGSADLEMNMFQQSRRDLAPYNMAGQAAIGQLMQYWGLGGPGGGGGGFGGIGIGTPLYIGGGTYSNQAKRGNTPLQDIQAALAAGTPVSDASWQMAGYGPGGQGYYPGTSAFPTAPGGTTNPTAGFGGVNAGAPSAGSAAGAFDMLKNYPGYQFQYGQGLEALNRNLNAGGRYASGAMMKDAQTFGQGQAESAVTNYLQMLQYLGTMGQNSAAQTGSLGANAARGAAGSNMAGATAMGSGIAGAAGSLGQLANNQNFQSLFNNQQSGPGYYGGGGGLPSVYITPQVPYYGNY